MLIAAGDVANFRAVLTPATISGNGLLVLPNALHALGSPLGAQVRYWQKAPQRQATKQPLVKAQL